MIRLVSLFIYCISQFLFSIHCHPWGTNKRRKRGRNNETLVTTDWRDFTTGNVVDFLFHKALTCSYDTINQHLSKLMKLQQSVYGNDGDNVCKDLMIINLIRSITTVTVQNSFCNISPFKCIH